MREKINERLATVLAIVIFIMAVLALRLIEIQIINGEELAEKAREQQMVMIRTPEENNIYIYMISRKRVDKIREKRRLNEIAEELDLEQIRKDDRKRYIYISGSYDERLGKELEKDFGTLIIENAENINKRLYVYADREGGLMPGPDIINTDELFLYK